MLTEFRATDFGVFTGSVHLDYLTEVNYLVGPNDSGKSSLLQAILSQTARSWLLTEAQKESLFDSQDHREMERYRGYVLCVDEPENHLHPALQKQIPLVLKHLALEYQCQFFVATHSPFVISGSGILTDQELEQSDSLRKDFVASQRVYFMKYGKIADKYGDCDLDVDELPRGRFGYWGSKASLIAAGMLGAGLVDFVSPQKSTPTSTAPLLVFCEGEGKDEDALIYNEIFRHHRPSVLFVSSRGSSQLHRSFQLVREIRSGLSANFQIRMLRDRDHLFSDDQAILDYELANPGVRVLRRRALEAYLYSSETAALLLKTRGMRLPAWSRRELNSLQRVIQSEAEEGVPGHSYKHRLKQNFQSILKESGFWEQGRPKIRNLALQIAELIPKQSKTYRELRNSILV